MSRACEPALPQARLQTTVLDVMCNDFVTERADALCVRHMVSATLREAYEARRSRFSFFFLDARTRIHWGRAVNFGPYENVKMHGI